MIDISIKWELQFFNFLTLWIIYIFEYQFFFMATRRDKTPILHRLDSESIDSPYSRSPNIYTKEFEREKTLKDNARGSLGRSKYKKGLEKKSSDNNVH
jgi:hypothetical protein